MLGGIGFTMSLFIGTLAFPDPSRAAELRIGVLTGSILSAIVGYLILSQCHGRIEKRKLSGLLTIRTKDLTCSDCALNTSRP